MAKKRSSKGQLLAVEIDGRGLDPLVHDLLNSMTPPKRRAALRSAALAAVDKVKKYYSDGNRDMWINKSAPTHGPGRRPTGWWRGTANGWSIANLKGTSVEMVNKTIGLAHKVTGGTIKPVRKKALTIPVSPDAHGHTVKSYSNTIAPVFRLGPWTGDNTLVRNMPGGGIKPVFKLSRGVTQKPWKGALPPVKDYMKAFELTILDTVERNIVKGGK